MTVTYQKPDSEASARTLPFDGLELRPTRGRRRPLMRRLLLIVDLFGVTLALVVAEVLFGPNQSTQRFDRIGLLAEVPLLILTLPLWLVAAKLHGLYDRDEERTDHSTVDDFVGIFQLVTLGAFLLLALAWVTKLANPTFPKVLTFWALAIGFLTIGRAVARCVARRREAYLQNTLIVGAGDVGQLVAHKLLQHPEYGINLLGLLDDEPKTRCDDLGDVTLLGPPERIPELVDELEVERVIVAFSRDPHEKILELVRYLRDRWIHVDVVPRLFELIAAGPGIHSVEGIPLFSVPPSRLGRSALLLKRTTDIVVAVLGLLLLAPVLGLLALAIKLDSPGGGVFFRQVRMGSGGRTFRIYKFRTMVVDAEERKAHLSHLNAHARPGGDPRMFKIPDDPRVTRLGRFLRRYALDELPQLINVLKGEMSLVGPRPLIIEEHECVDGWAKRRLDLKPGMTGLWQVLGRGRIPFAEMVRLDYQYVMSWSLWNDLRLLVKTFPALARTGASG